MLLHVLKNGIQVVIEFGRVLVTDATNFFHNWIMPFHAESPIKPAGVQMTGIRIPAAEQAAARAGCNSARLVFAAPWALARCG